MIAVCRRELRHIFHGLTGWGFLALLALITGGLLFVINVIGHSPNMCDGTVYYALGMALCCGLCGMNAYAGDRQDGTLRLLYTMPLSSASIALGKLLARWLLVLIGGFLMSLYPVCLGLFIEQMHIMEGLSCVIAACAAGMVFMALSVFCAAETRSAVTAFISYAAVVALVYLIPQFAPNVASATRLTLPLVLLLAVLAGAICYIVFGDILAGFIGAAIGLAPSLVCYLNGNGAAVFRALSRGMKGIGLFQALSPFTRGIMDLSVIIACLMGAGVFALASIKATAAARRSVRGLM